MRRILAAAGLALALVATAAPAGPAVAAGPARAAPDELAWGECPPPGPGYPRDPRLECATLAVPLNHRDPGGRHIDLAVSRIKSPNPAARKGILLSNPGGPGGTGLDLPSALAIVMPPEVTDRYDLIGFDPRGIGYSAPVSCGIPADPTLILPYPAPNGSIQRNVDHARRTAAGCVANSGDLLPYISTANTARDMDRIRAALGEPKLSYFGISYGTYLGAVYTTLFPHRSDRIVLDSGVDPNLVWHKQWSTFSAAVEQRLPDFLRWAAERHAELGLGATPREVRATFDRFTSALDRSPVVIEGVTFDGNLLREATRGSLYADYYFPLLAEYWQLAVQVTQGGQAAVSAKPALLAAIPADNQYSALYSVVCGDSYWPKDLGHYRREVALDRRLWPVTAGMSPNLWPCVYWPTPPIEPPVKVTGKGPRNVLVVHNTRDPATPWITGYGLRRALGQRAAMVTVDAGGHGAYAFGTCADAVTNAFLAGGALPAKDRYCAAQETSLRAASPTPPPPWIKPGLW